MPQGTQPEGVVPLGRTRGALSKEDLAKMQESFNLDTEDTDASDLRERMNKSTKKRKKTARKPPKSKTTKRSTKNLRENSPENGAVVVDEDDVLIQQEDVEDVVQKVPQLVDAFLILRNSQEQLKALQSSATRVDDIPITTNNDNTIVIGFRNKALAAQPVKFKIFRNDTFMKPLENYLKARAPDKTPSQCILKFDGEIVDHNKTPKDIALLDNLDIIDVIFVDTPLQNNNNNNTNPSTDNNNNTNPNSNIKSSASVVILDDDDETPPPRNDLQRAATTHLTVTESAQEKVKIKVRVDGGEVHKFMVSKTDPFGKVIRGLSEKLKCQPTHLKLIFDGMVVKEGSTPEDLDMEDGDLMDATTK